MLKKLIASVSAFAVLVAGLGTNLVMAAPVVTDPELVEAVSWAYDNGLTKYQSADAFMPFNNLTREQAAKFASQFAAEILDLPADTTQECTFKDASVVDASLTSYVEQACQQGIMLGYQGNFMPKQTLTRGQFATMVSRMIGGIDAMSTEQAHFDYLSSLGIMKTANLTSAITRGDALLMLYRLGTGSTTDLCAIDPNLPGCSAVDTGTVVKQGDLNVALNPSSPANYSSIPQVGSAKFSTVDFTAGTYDVTLSSVSLTRQGLGTPSDIQRVYFEKDGLRVSGKAAVSSDNKVVVSFAPALVVAAGKTVSLDLYADLSGAQAGGEHQFVSTAINSSAANVVGSVTTPLLRTANYTVSNVTFEAVASSSEYQIDGKLVELGQFRLKSPTRDSSFKAVTFTNSGVASLEYLSGIVLQRNGITVSTSATVNGRYLTFIVNNDTILNGQTALYSIKGIINNVDREGDGYQFHLKNTSDLNVVESSTQFRSSVTNGGYVMGLYKIKGADVKFATNAGFVTSVRAPQGASNVVLMAGTLTSKSDITLEDIKLKLSASTGVSLITKRLTLTIGGSTFTYSPDATATQTGTFDGTVVIPAGQVLAVKLVADTVENLAPANAWLQVANLTPSAFTTIEYVADGTKVTSALGSVQGAKLTVNPTNLQVSNTLSAAQTIVRGSNNIAVLAPKFSTSYDNSVRVNQFKLAISAGLAGTTWYLKDANGTVIANGTNNGGTVTFSNLNLIVSKTAAIATTVEVDNIPSDNATGDVTLTLNNIDAVDTTTWNAVTAGSLTKTVTIAEKATVTATTATNSTRLVYAGQTAVAIGTLSLKAANSDATITKLNMDMTSSNLVGFDAYKLNNLTLKDGTTALSSNVIVNSGTNFTFDGLSYAIPAGQTKTFTVYADIPELNTVGELNNTTFGLKLATDGGLYTSANQELTIAGGQTMSSAIKVVKTKVVVSNPAKANGGLTPSMSFVLTPSNGNTVTISSGAWAFLVSANNVSGATAVVVSSEANGLGTVYASGAIGGPLTGVNDLSISQATTVYVTIKTVTNWNPANASTPGNIVVSLTDFSYADSVADGDVVYANIYSSYVNDLGANISATLTQ